MSVQDSKTKLAREVARGLREGDGCLPEADASVNNASRAVIQAMHNEHGQAWLGKINLHGDERHGGHPVICKWDGGLVYNFGAEFVLSYFDAELQRLIQERDDAPYTSVAADVPRVNAIMARIKSLGGVLLIWT